MVDEWLLRRESSELVECSLSSSSESVSSDETLTGLSGDGGE